MDLLIINEKSLKKNQAEQKERKTINQIFLLIFSKRSVSAFDHHGGNFL